MALIQIIVLATVQGLTEFLPISSHGHLVIVDHLANWPDAGLKMRIAVHVGSLGAVFLYFRKELGSVLKGIFHILLGRNTSNSRLAMNLFLASIPVIAVGALIVTLGIQELLVNPTLIAWTMIIFGLLLWVADQTGMTVRKIEHMHGLSALIVGLAQVLALIPGTSRAGITITAARMMGYERTEASKFAMLLGIPVILAAGGWDAYEIWKYDDIQLGIDAILAALIAFITAYFSVSLLMSWLRHSSFTPFVLYRLFAGATILYIISMD